MFSCIVLWLGFLCLFLICSQLSNWQFYLFFAISVMNYSLNMTKVVIELQISLKNTIIIESAFHSFGSNNLGSSR